MLGSESVHVIDNYQVTCSLYKAYFPSHNCCLIIISVDRKYNELDYFVYIPLAIKYLLNTIPELTMACIIYPQYSVMKIAEMALRMCVIVQHLGPRAQYRNVMRS